MSRVLTDVQKERKKEYQRTYRLLNPEKTNNYNIKYRRKNPELFRNRMQIARSLPGYIRSDRKKYNTSYYRKNSSVIRTKSKHYYDKNFDILKDKMRKRSKKYVSTLRNSYVANISGFRLSDNIPVNYIEARKVIIMIKRFYKAR